MLADATAPCVHLGERECSLQRRHQKVVEEAPSPVVDAELRARMGEAAVALARACGYEGAGTVEFIATGDAGEFFFLEMNTRLQVEHPVTELVYGVDLVEQQLRVAAGEPLALRQAELVPRGHAVEARLYAEDPAAGFLPATGTVRAYREPGRRARRLGHRARAREVGTAYDPMLAKVIAHGPDRADGAGRLDRALATFELARRHDERRVHARAARARRRPRRRAGHRPARARAGRARRARRPTTCCPAAALAACRRHGARPARGPWRRRSADARRRPRCATAAVAVGGRTWAAPRSASPDDGAPRVALDGVERRYAVARRRRRRLDRPRRPPARGAHRPRRARPAPAPRRGSLEAPMPGTVLLVHVADGDAVDEGDVLLVLESMKMELSITAPARGHRRRPRRWRPATGRAAPAAVAVVARGRGAA